MRTGNLAQAGSSSSSPSPPTPPSELRESTAVADLFLGVFRRDLAAFYPRAQVVSRSSERVRPGRDVGPIFRLLVDEGEELSVDLFGVRHGVESQDGRRFSDHDVRMIRAIGAVLSLRYHHLFQMSHPSRLELFRGGSEDHYVAAFIEPWAYTEASPRPSRIASTVQTLRTAALSTYENRRVSTGALLLGSEHEPTRLAPADALRYGVELTALKSIHRLCDGKRTVFLVDLEGKLVEVVDIARWAQSIPESDEPDVPCARDYTAHARSTRIGGHLCLVLSPNQEIKLFAGGSQQFAFAHGRWRILDPRAKFAVWSSAVEDQRLARVLFQTALDLAECRQGGLFVVIDDPQAAEGRLVASHDLLDLDAPDGPSGDLAPGDPSAKRAFHYLARGRSIADLDPSVLEAFAGVDGAIVTDRSGRLLAYGAILRHDASSLATPPAEGARTTAAMVASHFGPVLKVSEDGVVSCFLGGHRVWDL